ncbi:tetratricopeptide repeat protein [Lagierella sp.]|uniref:tetratricopeptide repeat protein n=1 Tax=Lagierella sp. TaxID=2849657 RepID=UPI002637E910|nr:tetratricopeptide repeat protein [Lagierella sp.]
MNNIRDFFNDKTKNIYFLELKDKGIYNFPLPIIKSDFMEELKNDTFTEEIDMDYFIRGMLYICGVDEDFLYKKEYLNFLKESIDNPEGYLMTLAMEEVEFNHENALIFFKFIHENFSSEASDFAYASALKDYFDNSLDALFLEESKKVLNENIRKYPGYPYNYILFGTIEMIEQNPMKAEYYLRKALELSSGNSYEAELRDKIAPLLHEVVTDSGIQKAFNLLQRGEYKEVVNILENIDTINYKKNQYLAMAHYNLGNTQRALNIFEDTHKEHQDLKDPSFFIDYSFVLAQVGLVMESLGIINIALDSIGENAPLLFNRAVIYLNLGLVDKAKEDLENVVSYYDISEELFNNAMILLEKIKTLDK